MNVQFEVVRQSSSGTPWIQTYGLNIESGTTVLDCLNQIKWEQDGSLAFRKNCRNTICGSCSMRINGRAALACKETVGTELIRLQQTCQTLTYNDSDHVKDAEIDSQPVLLKDSIPTIRIAPMGNMPVIKDLVVDMTSFWENLDAVNPYVSNKARQLTEREFLQTPEERDRLNQTGNCILCGACYSECNAREVDPTFVGPHALAKAYRMVSDSRDQNTEERLDRYNQKTQGVWGCTRCYYCNSVCPMGVAPMDQIGKIKEEILDRKDEQSSRSVRHRKALIDLVKQGGWIDERRFGLRVVGNSFRDLGGMASLGPLGLRMLTHGKFPLAFEPSEGTAEVRSLIQAVQKFEGNRE